MASLVVSGDTSGAITLSAPAVAGTNTLSLPAQTATLATLTTPSFATTIGVGGATAAASGAGITFPATQSASSNANTLDDYEEGDWTPTIAFTGGTTGSQTYTNQTGRYIKVGRLVTVNLQLSFNKGSLSGGYFSYINGLPFTSTNTSGVLWTSWSGWYNPSGTSFINLLMLVPQNQARLEPYRMLGAGIDSAPLPIAISEIGGSLSLYVTASYYSAD
jgi:hypothetical protein